MSRKLSYESRSIVSAPSVATAATATSSARCGTRGARFWIETAVEYTFANASSVSSTVTASSARTAPIPPAATATGSAAGSVMSREKKRIGPEPPEPDAGQEVAGARAPEGRRRESG